jgi:FemAB-related protein (PEP-CTERM system-associated)
VIETYQGQSRQAYEEFLAGDSGANYCHDPAWLDVFREGYGKTGFILCWKDPASGKILASAPAALLASPLFGRTLVGLPYLDYGGIACRDPAIQEKLRLELLSRARAGKAGLELRCTEALAGLPQVPNIKVAMTLPLTPGGADAYWKSLDAKVRNQVRKAEKSAVSVRWGREENLDDFYRVFCVNMRDLGSPVHAKRFFSSVLKHFPGAQVGTAFREGRCIGGLFRILWGKTLVIPWASTLKEERVHCANNALYWESIRFAFEQGCQAVDFGRSSKEEGTYRFKQQWLARESPLHWYQFDAEGGVLPAVRHAATGKLGMLKSVWARLPLPLANFAGPLLRGSIAA